MDDGDMTQSANDNRPNESTNRQTDEQPTNNRSGKKRSSAKRSPLRCALRVAGIAIAALVALIVVLVVLIYLPPIQNMIVHKAAAVASEQTGMNVAVERVGLKFPLDLSVKGIRLTQPNADYPQLTDTIADISEVVVNVRLLPLLRLCFEVDALEVIDARFDTDGLIASARVSGALDRLFVSSHGIDLSQETVRVNLAEISDADILIEMLNDTTAADTTTSENAWRLNVDSAALKRTSISLLMQGDTTRVSAYMGLLAVADAGIDLGRGRYEVRQVTWTDGRAGYDSMYEPEQEGLDYSHIAVTDVNVVVDSVVYDDTGLSLHLSRCTMLEKSGLAVVSLTTTLGMDTMQLSLPDISLITAASEVNASFSMDLDAFEETEPGVLALSAYAAVGKEDLMLFLGDMPDAFVKAWPDERLTVDITVEGNMQSMNIAGLNAELPSAFQITADGVMTNLADTDNMTAGMNIDAVTRDLAFVTALATDGGEASFAIPQGISISGDISMAGSRYTAHLTATESGGHAYLDADIDTAPMSYTADVRTDGLQLSRFLPGSGLGDLTCKISLKGHGTDITASGTSIGLNATVDAFDISGHDFDNMSLNASVDNGTVTAALVSDNSLLKGSLSVGALMHGEKVKATLAADIASADLYNMLITDNPLSIALCCHLDFVTDMEQLYGAEGSIGDITLRTADKVFRPADIEISALTDRDTTHADIETGDFSLAMRASGGYARLLTCADSLTAKVSSDLNERRIDYAALRRLMPRATLRLQSGRENPLYRFLEQSGVCFNEADFDIVSSPERGLNGRARVCGLAVDSMLIDTLYLGLHSTETNMEYRCRVCNNEDNPQHTFTALVNGEIMETGLSIKARYLDADGETGVKIGLTGNVETDGIRVSVLADDPVIAYKKFSVNDDNYIFLGSDRRITANLDIEADDGQAFRLHSDDTDTEALQDLTLTLERFDLGQITATLPYVPEVTGTLDAEVGVKLTRENLTVMADAAVEKLTYEGSDMGDVAVNFTYIPTPDGTHTIDGGIKSYDRTVASLTGTYSQGEVSTVDARLTADRFPMSLVNGFIPDGLIGFRGYCNGDLTVNGDINSPRINGEIVMDSCRLFSKPYGIELTLSDTPVSVTESNVVLENYNMYANNGNALTVDGNVDFADLDNMRMDMTIRAKDFLLIDAKESRESIAYGKAFVNFFGRLQGPMANLSMGGRLDVLATTDVSYVLTDTPLSTDNQFEGLVTFTDFTDTIPHTVTRPVPEGFSMDLTVSVTQGAHVTCYLNTDKTNYVDLLGGGDLRLIYGASGDMTLTGKYTLNNGEMKYSLPVIPLKTFTIQDGSYIEFTGDAMNPTLNITATEQVKTTVSTDGSEGRMVQFECGVIITKTLSDMGLEFTLDAPEDLTVHNELSAMSVEQRGKLAVTMLTTGMYLADGNTSGFTMNNALSSFLQNEISNITGNALRTLDLSFGLDNATDASGNTHTDYSFKFAKRFWNNRLNIIIGGKVSSGTETTDRNDSFLDNVTFEYRLDDTSNKYVKLFYDNNAYDWLEGNTSEYGVGFIWRRSLQHFKDIFKF